MKKSTISGALFLLLVSFSLGACSGSEAASDAMVGSEASAETEAESVMETELESELVLDERVVSVDNTNGYISNGKNLIRINIENVLQNDIGLPNGCEVVSLAIALSYYGYDVDPIELFEKYMKKGEFGEANPFYAYVGDPRDGSGYGCYAPCAVRCVNAYLEDIGSDLRAYDISGATIDEICECLWDGIPVVMWGTIDMQPSSVAASWSFSGNIINWYSKSHCVVARGVNNDNMFICDPMGGKGMYSMEDVERAYNQIYSQAVIIK